MRFDFLDMRGKLRIRGNPGFENAAPAFNNGQIEWMPVGVGNSTYSIVGATGYNYIVVGASGSSLENGQKLLDANEYSQTNWSGSPAIDNRFTILLTPGVYELPTNLYPYNYVDFVGISTNPYNTILRGQSIIYNPFTDSSLENLHLYGENPIISPGVGEYPRWKNLVVSGDNYSNTWYGVFGEYTDIIVEDNAKFAIGSNIFMAKFKNIKAKNVTNIFECSSGDLTGTFENIEIDNVISGNPFSSGTTNLFGRFKNIKINQSDSPLVFFAPISLNCEFQDIEVGYLSNGSLFSSGIIDGSFRNIIIGSVSGFCFTASTITGTFSNISVDSVGGDLFVGGINLKLNGLDVGKVDGSLFKSLTDTDIDGIFHNINTGRVLDSFFSSERALLGTYSSLDIGTVGNGAFLADKKNDESSINISIHDYKISLDDSSIFSSWGTVSLSSYRGIISNANNFLYSRNGNIYTTLLDTDVVFANVTPGISSFFVRARQFLYATVSNFKCSDITGDAEVFTSQRIYGEFLDLEFGNITGSFFDSLTTITSNSNFYKNIKVGNISGNAFCNVCVNSAIFENIKINNCANAFLTLNLDSVIRNLEVGDVSGDILSGTGSFAAGTIFGDYRNIKIGNVSQDVFRSWQTLLSLSPIISGVFKDINIKSAKNVFRTTKTSPTQIFINDARFENIKIGTCSTIFDAAVKENVRVRSLEVDGGWTSVIYQGSLENSYINSKNKTFTTILGTSSVISRSRIISPVGSPLSVSDGFHYLSQFNQVTGLSTPTSFTNSNYNIIDTDFS